MSVRASWTVYTGEEMHHEVSISSYCSPLRELEGRQVVVRGKECSATRRGAPRVRVKAWEH